MGLRLGGGSGQKGLVGMCNVKWKRFKGSEAGGGSGGRETGGGEATEGKGELGKGRTKRIERRKVDNCDANS